MENIYENTLQHEQEKISCQTRLLLLYKKQLRQKKAEVLQLIQDSAYRTEMSKYKNELDDLKNTLQRVVSNLNQTEYFKIKQKS